MPGAVPVGEPSAPRLAPRLRCTALGTVGVLRVARQVMTHEGIVGTHTTSNHIIETEQVNTRAHAHAQRAYRHARACTHAHNTHTHTHTHTRSHARTRVREHTHTHTHASTHTLPSRLIETDGAGPRHRGGARDDHVGDTVRAKAAPVTRQSRACDAPKPQSCHRLAAQDATCSIQHATGS